MTRKALLAALALGLWLSAGAPAAQADRTIASESVSVTGATVRATMKQHSNGAVYAVVTVRDTATDGVCAHGTLRWHHLNGNGYDDYGMFVCGTGAERSFTVPARDWRAYWALSVGAFVDGGETNYDRIRRWDRQTLRREADRIMRMRYREFVRYRKEVAPWPFDWSNNGCNSPTPRSWDKKFRAACEQHDFGYRNYGHYLKLGRDDATRKWIDGRLLIELIRICRDRHWDGSPNYIVCVNQANTMHSAVRVGGRKYFYG